MIRAALLSLCSIIIIAVAIFMNKNNPIQTNQVDNQTGIIVEGILASIDRSCTYDAPTCSISLDDGSRIIFAYAGSNKKPEKEILVEPVRMQMGKVLFPTHIITTDDSLLKGKKVEAFVAKVSNREKVYTLLGNEEFYIKIID